MDYLENFMCFISFLLSLSKIQQKTENEGRMMKNL